MPRAFELAAAQPWLVQPEALDTLLAVADGMGDPVALEARLGRHLDNSRTVTMRVRTIRTVIDRNSRFSLA